MCVKGPRDLASCCLATFYWVILENFCKQRLIICETNVCNTYNLISGELRYRFLCYMHYHSVCVTE